MSNGTGQGPKKETVYSGSTPGIDNKGFTKPPAPGTTGTVYGGPSATQGATQGTVYGGPSPQGTVFDENKFAPKANKVNASVAIKATTRRVRATAIGFFIVSGISLLEAIFYWTSDTPLAIGSAFTFGVFLIIGFFTFRLSRVALLAGIAIYLLDTLLILYQAFATEGGLMASIFDIALHAFILYRLWLTYGQLEELHSLD
ncbi:MAG TPA: hypothetical protein VK738_16895 [Terriglobales bacterium]|jgi:hypothetical protein|nr:hypothetical protein [Terriglobales bacterium]